MGGVTLDTTTDSAGLGSFLLEEKCFQLITELRVEEQSLEGSWAWAAC